MYKKVEVTERALEELVRLHPGLIEDGMTYVTHQTHTRAGRLDVLLVDSGRSLVVAELKVVEDDAMLTQCLDYFDHVSAGVETYARMHAGHGIDPTQPVRMLLIAPGFSQTLVNRCKWIDADISLFAYTCLRFEAQEKLVPVYIEHAIPPPADLPIVHREGDRLAYITDAIAKARAASMLEWHRSAWSTRSSADPIKYAISLKVDNKVVARIVPRRKHFIVDTYNSDDRWTSHAINGNEDLETAQRLIQEYVTRRL